MSKIDPKNFKLKNGEKIVIRSAETNDAQALIDLWDEIVSEDEFNVTIRADIKDQDITIEKEQNWIQEHNDKEGWVVLVAEFNGIIVGGINVENGLRRRIAHVGTIHISVRKKYRGLGVGKALLQCTLDWAGTNSLIEKLALGVFENNQRAIGLYKKMGFVEEGRRLKEVKIQPGKYLDSIIMYKFVK
jgi:RimJ/RimL family protein N-acetyltransferase